MSVTLLYAESQAALYFTYASRRRVFCIAPSEITLVNSLTFALSAPSLAGVAALAPNMEKANANKISLRFIINLI